MRKKRLLMAGYIFLAVILSAATALILFLNSPAFGRLPRGERLKRIERMPYYHNGEFRNLQDTVLFVSEKGFAGNMWKFLFGKKDGIRPDRPVPVVRTDLQAIDPDSDILVWFGHSSYLLQIGGTRILTDPVFCQASPVSFVNRPFPGTMVYTPADMPDIDVLIITHDHWDHLDYRTVKALKDRIGKIVCPLGVGEHFARWGFDPHRVVELGWDERACLSADMSVHCLPSRHFSGRGLKRNKSLWASFLIESPEKKIYLSGDGGYGSHFARIGEQFGKIDWAILENGQYNKAWPAIHLLPDYMEQTVKDLNAQRILTVHHSKYALSTHPWDEPLHNAQKMQEDSVEVAIPKIGEVVMLNRP